jgi:hypothetical protein
VQGPRRTFAGVRDTLIIRLECKALRNVTAGAIPAVIFREYSKLLFRSPRSAAMPAHADGMRGPSS